MGGTDLLCLKGTTLTVGDFVWAENERPSSSTASSFAEQDSDEDLVRNMEKLFPEVDLGLSDEELVPLLHSAASSWGFFRIFNHGVPHTLMDSISAHALQFFNLPLSDKLAIARNPPVSEIGYKGFAQSAVIKSWCEALHVMPGEDHICSFLDRVPSLPDRAGFRADLMEYFSLVGALALRILQLLFRGLDLDEAEVKMLFDNIDHSNMRINHYPACPVANLLYGSPAHKDYAGLNILHQDDVGGLEVLKDGRWVGVKPEKGYLIVNVGDLIQIMSNARYKSVLHRSLVHSLRPRLSFGLFYYPPEEKVIAPLAKLGPAKYKSFYMREYRSMFQKAQKAHHSPSLFFEENL